VAYQPIYDGSVANVNNLTTPVYNALTAYRRRGELEANRQLQREKMLQEQANRDQALGLERDSLGLRREQMKQASELANKRFDLDERRFTLQDSNMGLQRKLLKSQLDQRDMDLETRKAQEAGNLALIIQNEKDPAIRAQHWQQLAPTLPPQYQSMPLEAAIPALISRAGMAKDYISMTRPQGNQFGRSGTIVQDRDGNFYSVQFGGDGTRKVEPLQMGQTPLQPSKGTEVVGDTIRSRATGRVIENVGQNIAGAEKAKIVGRNEGENEVNFPKATAQFKMAEQKWSRVQPSIERARQLIRSNPAVVGLIGTAAARIPGTAAYRLGQYLETIKANIGFSELQAMREASPTGGALGQVAVFENILLQLVQGSLQQGLDAPTLLQNLDAIDTNLREVRRITSDAFRQTYGNRIPQGRQPQTAAPQAGTYNWTPEGGLQRAR